MNIKTVEERTEKLEFMWKAYHNKKVCKLLLDELSTNIVFFLGVMLPKELEERLDRIEDEINDCE